MTWATVVRDWNRSGKKVISDPDDVYALPLRGTAPYNTVRKIYERERSKAKRKEVKMSQEEVLKPKIEKLKKFIEDINQPDNLEQIMKLSEDLSKMYKAPERVIEFPAAAPAAKTVAKNKPGDIIKQNPEYARFFKYLSPKERNALNVRRRAYIQRKNMSPDEAIREAMNRHPRIKEFREMEEGEL